MAEQDEKIRELEERLDKLVHTQIDFQKEISLIRGELMRLRSARAELRPDRTIRPVAIPPEPPRQPAPRPPVRSQPETPAYSVGSVPPRPTEYENDPVLSSATVAGDPFSRFASKHAENARANLEKFIGQNLISLIGIIVLVLGVGIGAKYAIDNNLISPLARIVIGYIFGFGLVGLAIKLKSKYLTFSAVLISGGMAIMYFVTYFAYSSYALISQLPAFALMTMFTIFTVAAALVYSRQVIAHIGLVGAYAVPFLLSDDSGNYLALFTYMAVINAGILAVSITKYWKPLFYTSSVFTWVIFYGWFVTKYAQERHFDLALIFLAVFFAVFYATKLIQRFRDHDIGENAKTENLVCALATGFVLFGFIVAISDSALDTAQVWKLFSYVAAASVVILATSFRVYGRAFMYIVVPFAWLIYGVWFLNRYDASLHFQPAVTFALLFFAIFYLSILFHRLVEDTFTLIEHSALVLANAFIFYGLFYLIMDGDPELQKYLGLYTAANAALHLAVSHLVSRLRSNAVDVVQVLTLLVLTFASIAIPVQFDGNLVTLIWSAQGAVLFWFGRTRGVRLFEYFSYPVMVLATGSLFYDWTVAYSDRITGGPIAPIANGDFVAASVFVAAFAFIYITNRDERHAPAINGELVRPLGYMIAGLAVFVLYNLFRIEIGNYFHLKSVDTERMGLATPSGPYADLQTFNVIWQINYTLLFLTAMGAVNLKRFRSRGLAFTTVALAGFALFIFATLAMFFLSELRMTYVAGGFDPAFMPPWLYIGIRPISYLFAAATVYILYESSRDSLITEHVTEKITSYGFEAIAYALTFIVASCELVNLMGQFGIPDATKLGLSILWGVYALMMIAIGIARTKKHLRIAAFVLLAVTLAKLFLYDIADLDTIPKTILFVTLGITLLVVSFLYNKYKNVIFKTEPVSEE